MHTRGDQQLTTEFGILPEVSINLAADFASSCHKMAKFLLTYSLVFAEVYSAEIRVHRYKMAPDRQQCSANDVKTTSFVSRSKLECSIQCAAFQWCEKMAYDVKTGLCFLNGADTKCSKIRFYLKNRPRKTGQYKKGQVSQSDNIFTLFHVFKVGLRLRLWIGRQ